MEEIVKHINDTNASYRSINAGDAKNTDLFLDNEHYDLFKDMGDQITVRFNKENLQKAVLFIASILPRKYDNSATHKRISFSSAFVFDQLAFLDAVFTIDGIRVETRTQVWNVRKDIPKKNGEIDNRFYFNGLLEDVPYKSFSGENKTGKFTIRNYVAGGYSDLHIKKASDGIFDIWVTNTQTPYDDGKDKHHEISDTQSLPLQQIFYGAPGTGKSHATKVITETAEKEGRVFRTTFHPDSDYSTFVGAYKPTMSTSSRNHRLNLSMEDLAQKLGTMYNDEKLGKIGGLQKFCYDYFPYISGEFMSVNVTKLLELAGVPNSYNVEVNKYINFCGLLPKPADDKIVYSFIPQAFTNAYVKAWSTTEDIYLIIEEINRGNCAQIFGDLFQLLDRNEKGESDYHVDADTDLGNYIASELESSVRDDFPEGVKEGKKLVLPSNLYIWATMNTSDQSLFPIDSAFKRRWDWKYMPIENEEKGWKIVVNKHEYDWYWFLKTINQEVLDLTHSEDKQLGYFFAKAKDGIIDAETLVNKVYFYLWTDVFKDYDYESQKAFLKPDGKGAIAFKDFFKKGEVVEAIAEQVLINLEHNQKNEPEG